MNNLLLPIPKVALNIRLATLSDIPFMDSMQKLHTKQVGWMPTKTFEGKVALSQVLIAESNGESVGYCIGQDRYFKRDDVGIVYQLLVAPGKQRGFIGSALLKAQFDRSAYGCRLYCCWCAQDIAANHFWEAMGFVPLAFRAGSEKKSRVHIFWQKRIRAGDTTTPWWFPSLTTGGSIREDRLVLPIPRGAHWSDDLPRILPVQVGTMDTLQLESETEREGASGANTSLAPSRGLSVKKVRAPKVTEQSAEGTKVKKQEKISTGGLRFEMPKVETEKKEKPKRQPKPKMKYDAKIKAMVREICGVGLDELNGINAPVAIGKYEISRAMDQKMEIEAKQVRMLGAA